MSQEVIFLHNNTHLNKGYHLSHKSQMAIQTSHEDQEMLENFPNFLLSATFQVRFSVVRL